MIRVKTSAFGGFDIAVRSAETAPFTQVTHGSAWIDAKEAFERVSRWEREPGPTVFRRMHEP